MGSTGQGRVWAHHHYKVTVPAPARWLNLNDRDPWQTRHRIVATWREAAGWAAKAARVPELDRVYVLAVLHFAERRRRDPANWSPTVKACIDGLVDARIIRDDSADILTGPDIRLGAYTTTPYGRLNLYLYGGI